MSTKTSNVWKQLGCVLIALLLMLAIFASLCALSGVKPDTYKYPSYLLQAQAWLRGELALDRNYEYLELAVYEGRYYVSFPPIPTIPMVLWTLIWGDDVPGGLFQKIYVAIACVVVLTTLMRRKNARLGDCIAWAIFICFSSALLPITLVGGVWYEAQIFAFLFSVSAIAAMYRNHPTLSCLCYALSVGCRPFSVCLGPVLLALYLHFNCTEEDTPQKILRRLAPGLIVGLCVATAYAVFNFVRFGNPFEFGHNYLPEFQNAEHGQFSLHYIADNWRTLFFGAPFHIADGQLTFEKFGFSMFLSCPLLICNIVWIIVDVVRRKFTREKLIIVLMSALTVFLLLLHRTLGAHQFGLRYAIELMPLCFAYLLLCPDRQNISRWETAVLTLGLAFNLIGGSVVHI